MTPGQQRRSYSPEMKLRAMERMRAGEGERGLWILSPVPGGTAGRRLLETGKP
jgi:hypothetical protein